jgi:hypothetical protein
MWQDNERHRDKHTQQLSIHAEWRVGPRTAAWDALWRRILEDLHPRGPRRRSSPLSEGVTDE